MLYVYGIQKYFHMSKATWNCTTHLAFSTCIRAYLPPDIVRLVNGYVYCWNSDNDLQVEPAFDVNTNTIMTDDRAVAVGLAPVVYTDRPHVWLNCCVQPMSNLNLLFKRYLKGSSPIFVTLDIEYDKLTNDHRHLIMSNRHNNVNLVLFMLGQVAPLVRSNVDALVCSYGSNLYKRFIPPAKVFEIRKTQRALREFDDCQNTKSFLVIRVYQEYQPLAIFRINN